MSKDHVPCKAEGLPGQFVAARSQSSRYFGSDPGRFDRCNLGHIDVGRSLSEGKRLPWVSRRLRLSKRLAGT